MKLEFSEVIDRPPADVFRFIATDHVQNHPRWDPQMELQQVTEGPIGVGTVIHRRHTHSGAPQEGTMEVVEFEPPHVFGLAIHDGPVEMVSRMAFEPSGQNATRILATLDVPTVTEPMDRAPIERSLNRMKELIEAESDAGD
jgi:uncharacterized protein YndB with AHSA1/START domain